MTEQVTSTESAFEAATMVGESFQKMTGVRREAKPRGRPRLAPDGDLAPQERGEESGARR